MRRSRHQPAGRSPRSVPAYSIRVVPSRLGPILTDAKEMTLYHYKADADGKTACLGQCAVNWPPLPASGTPTAQSVLGGKLATFIRPDAGDQVIYNDRPLYTFAGDNKPGDVAGPGIAGAWFVATPSLTDPDAATEQPPAPATVTPGTATPAATARSRPGFNDQDGDNAGGASDGDGNG